MKKKFFFALILILIGSSGGLIIAEIALRLILPTHKTNYARAIVLEDPTTGQTVHKKNMDELIYSGEAEREVRIKTNAEGYVGKDYPVEKPPGKKRIAILGDSYVAALQVDVEQNFSSQLEGKLKDTEVLNFGVGGQGTVEELLRYEAYVKKYQPDLVVLVFYPNDFENNQYYVPIKEKITAEGPILVEAANANNKAGRRDIKIWLMDHSYLVRFLDARVKQNAVLFKIAIATGLQHQGILGAPENGIHPSFFIFEQQPKPEVTEVFEFTTSVLEVFSVRAKENSSEFLVVYFPQADQVDENLWTSKNESLPQLREYEWDLDGPNTYLKSKLDIMNIPFLDFTPIFREHYKSTSTWIYNGGGGHLNPNGHALVTEELKQRTELLLRTKR